jgi:methionyl-tRNA synthetase
MGRAKDRQIEREETWERIAADRGYRCEGCGGVLTKDEYDTWGDCCMGCAPSLKPDHSGRG